MEQFHVRSEDFFMKNRRIRYIWEDRPRKWGMPLSFTKYMLSEDRLFVEKGLLKTRYEEVELYRVNDLSLTVRLGQRLFGVGTLRVYSSDKTAPVLDLVNIRDPREVKELIRRQVEDAKMKRRPRY